MQAQRHGWKGRLADIRSDLAAERVTSTLVIGVVLGVVNALLSIALVSLIFQGDLSGLLPLGIGLALAASSLIAIIMAVGSGVSGMQAGVQDASAAILGLAAASIAMSTGGASAETVVALMAVTSFSVGATLLLMGRFRLGEISRYLPFPVIGGLLAGTGYLIVTGSLEILGGLTRDGILGAGATGLFWPGLALALAFFAASRREMSSRTYLLLLVAAVGGFHAALAAAGVSIQGAAAKGWLLGPLPEGSLWPGAMLTQLGEADWSAIASEAPALVTVLLIVPVTVVLYISALEVEFKQDIDTSIELRTMGWANVASGLVGGPPGYIYLADTIVTRRLVGNRRGAALVAAVAIALVLFVGAGALELLPQFVVGGLLLFVGFDFLAEWLWDARRKMAALDYLLMLGIVVMVATVGFLAGVAAGLAIAIVLFVVRYSQIEVVKHSLSGTEHRSNIERAPAATKVLDSEGERVAILQLQGFIFFGTGNRIVEEAKRRLASSSRLDFLILDFRLVTGIDSSALMTFERLATMGSDHGFVVVFTGLDEPETSQIRTMSQDYEGVVRLEEDVDRGVAWCEDRILEDDTSEIEFSRSLPRDLEMRLGPYLEEKSFAAGTTLMDQGDPAPGLYLIVSGRASVLIDGPDGADLRLRSLLEGTLIGEISLYDDAPVTAKVVAETDCRVLHLTVEAFDRLCLEDARLAADLHAFVAATLAARVIHANRTIRALRR